MSNFDAPDRSEPDQIIADLLEWASIVGGFDGPSWARARDYMTRVRSQEDLERFIERLRAEHEATCTPGTGYGVTDAVADVLNDHYGLTVTPGSRNRCVAGPGDSRDETD